MPFTETWMQLETITLSEVSQKEKNKYHRYHSYVYSKIWHKWTNELIYETELGYREQTGVAKEEGGGRGMEWKVGVIRCKLLYLEWIKNKFLLYITGNYIQYPVIDHKGKEYF